MEMKPNKIKSTIQTKLEFNSSDVSHEKSEAMEENSDKVPPSFSQSHSSKNTKRKSLNITVPKTQRKHSGGANIQAILGI